MGFDVEVVERIAWHEGMLLAPQHFQQLSARVDSLVAAQVRAASPLSWGLSSLKLDEHLLATGLLRIVSVEAIFPDGTLVAFSAERDAAPLLELDLGPYAPEMQQQGVNVFLSLAPVARRFVSARATVAQDQVSEAEAIEVPRWTPALFLTAGAAPGPGHSSLMLGDFIQEGSTVKRGALVGPVLYLTRDDPLWNAVAQVLAQLRAKSVYLARQTLVPSSDVEGRLAQLELRVQLAALMAGLPMAEGVLRSGRPHPWNIYLALLGLAGRASLLRPGQVVPMALDYVHERPQEAIEPLIRFLQDMASEVNEDYYLAKFHIMGDAFELEMEAAMTGEQLMLGVSGPSERDVRNWMAGAIIGSDAEFASLRNRRILGAARRALDHTGAGSLKTGGKYALYVVAGDTLKPGSVLRISNPNERESSSRPAEIVLFVADMP